MSRATGKRAIVIGGGVGGLACGLRLEAEGRDVTVAEADDRPGGSMWTAHQDGFLLERGPFNVLVRSPHFEWLIEHLGDAARPVSADAEVGGRRYLLMERGLAEVPAGPRLLTSPMLSVGARARLLAGMIRSRPGSEGESIDDMARRRFGREFAEVFVSALTVGIWGAESDELEPMACFGKLAQVDREIRSPILAMKRMKPSSPRKHKGLVSFDGGLGGLADAMANRLGDRLRTGARVAAVTGVAGAWEVTLESGETLAAEDLVLACGTRAASALTRALAPVIADELDGIDFTPLTVVNLAYRRDQVEHPLDGYGFLVPRAMRAFPLLGVLWASSVFPAHAPDGSVLIRVFVGGTRHPELADAPEAELVERIAPELERLLGARGEPLLADVARWPDVVPVYRVGHAARVRRLRSEAERIGIHLAGNFMDGLSVSDCVARGVATANAIVNDQPTEKEGVGVPA